MCDDYCRGSSLFVRHCDTDKLCMLDKNTVELQSLEHLWDHENMFETGVVRANEC